MPGSTSTLPPLKYFDVRDGAELIVCYRCGCVIVDDIEGASRGDHESWHAAVEPQPEPTTIVRREYEFHRQRNGWIQVTTDHGKGTLVDIITPGDPDHPVIAGCTLAEFALDWIYTKTKRLRRWPWR